MARPAGPSAIRSCAPSLRSNRQAGVKRCLTAAGRARPPKLVSDWDENALSIAHFPRLSQEEAGSDSPRSFSCITELLQ
jgi:hypothetical protein